MALVGRVSVLGVLVDSHTKLTAKQFERFDFIIADKLQAFAFVVGKIDDSFIARQVFGELAVVFAGAFWPAFLFVFFGVFDDLFRISDRFFERTDDFGRDFFAELQQ